MSARNRFAPTLESLTERVVLSCVIDVSPQVDGTNIVTVTGDAADDTVAVTDAGNGNVFVTATGAMPTFATKVSRIYVDTGLGNDAVRYELTGDLAAGSYREVLVNLGAKAERQPGNDRFDAVVRSGVTLREGSSLSILADGGDGNDTLNVLASGVTVAPNAYLWTKLRGGAGADTITQNYAGTVADYGIVEMTSNGDAGNDSVRQTMQFLAGTSTTAVGRGYVYGGDGNDTLGLYVFAPTTMTKITAELHGDDDGIVGNDALSFNAPYVKAFN